MKFTRSQMFKAAFSDPSNAPDVTEFGNTDLAGHVGANCFAMGDLCALVAGLDAATSWMLRSFVAAVPVELGEAAKLDGASSFRFVRSVLFPLVAPGVVACSEFSVISTWNDFLFAKTFIISAQENSIMTDPVLIFFIAVQRRLVSGLAGAVKG
ncbi:ABC-type glycerol-3-phosphate transport system permease component [Arthrobacter stackebrandtii]|uniref:ABC-type glycerol-3-phosphate transport system permease component n=1 Tax=Arthrobacter stackebrandtii TaxID=272161 RepID=A0ABS4Z2U7_9MICC|nr:ABC-type glycerol-3-phosphate transport system permease component [Arthrobacter stackebrandtii]